MFQYKIIHIILPYSNVLVRLSVILCTISGVEAISWWNSQSGNSYTLDELNIFDGYFPAERTTRLFNCYILLGKRYNFVQRLELESLPRFLDFVKNRIIVQRAICQSKGQMYKFYSLLKPFLSLLETMLVG